VAGLYLHIPYCKQACSYCDFYFSTVRKSQGAFVEALVREIALRKTFFQPTSALSTVYLGGGTPSLVSPRELDYIFEAIHKHYTLLPEAEITLEANPDDITPEALRAWQAVGINRLSIGVQSFLEADLQLMRRAHTAQQAESCVLLAQDMGFANISIDLIYHLPGRTLPDWIINVDQAMALGTQHLSCYGLTVEPRTLLAHQIAKGELALPPDELFSAQYLALVQRAGAKGYSHYEVASFAQPGFHSRHNSAYWHRQPYLGLGPSAHSFDGARTRSWNLADLHSYNEALQAGSLPAGGHEHLSPAQVWNECLLTGLRTAAGFCATHISERHGLQVLLAPWLAIAQEVIAYIEAEDLGSWTEATGTLQLQEIGMLQADRLTALLMLEEA
jgi:oxygen-independent coproporphyrinogen III oxidase